MPFPLENYWEELMWKLNREKSFIEYCAGVHESLKDSFWAIYKNIKNYFKFPGILAE